MNRTFLIKDIARVTNGKSDVKDANHSGKYAFFDRSALNKRSNRFLFDGEAIIIPGEDSREIFEPRYFNGKFDLHQRCYAVYDFKDAVYPKYLYYKLRTLTKHFANVFVGSTVPSLRLDHITDLGVELPPLADQKKLSHTLSLLDSKIELNNRINAELEQAATDLYNYWFVQFDFPDAKGKPYKSSGGKMVWNDKLKREIPEGWTVKKMKEITPISTEAVDPRANPNKLFKHLSIPSFDSTGSYIEEPGAAIGSNKFIASEQDILVSKLNPRFSRVIYVTREEDLVCSTEFVVWRPKNQELKPFLFFVAKSPEFIAYCAQSASGTSNSHRRVNPTVMMGYPLAYDESVCEMFGEYIESAIRQSMINRRESKLLISLRDWLLPMLMNGQVSVN